MSAASVVATRPAQQESPSRHQRGAVSHPLAFPAACAAILGWASLYAVSKPALAEVGPVDIALARAGIAAGVLAFLAIATNGGAGRGTAHLLREARRSWHLVAVVGVIVFTGTSLIAMTAQRLLPASLNGVLNNLAHLWVAIYAAIAGRPKNAALLVAGSAVAAAGVAAVVLGGTGAAAGFTWTAATVAGAIISVSGSLLISAGQVLQRRVMPGRDPLAVTAVAAAWGTLPLLLLIALGVGGAAGDFAAASWETRLRLVWLGTACTAFNFSLWAFALAHLPVTRIMPLQYLVSPLGVAVAVVLLGERPGLNLVIGALAIVAGIVIARRGAEPA